MTRPAKIDDVAAALAASARAPWAITAERVPAITAVTADLVRGREVSPARLQTALAAGDTPRRTTGPVHLAQSPRGGMIAVVSVRGIALFDFEMQPYAFSTRRLAATMRDLAADNSVTAIILDFGTPGGVVTGTPEAADAIAAAAKRKPVIAAVNPLAASAGYWLASQASEIAITPSGDAGSIGVFVLHLDFSRAMDADGVTPTFVFAGERKVDGNPLEPLTDRARGDMQADVNSIYLDFKKAVARGRGVSVGEVEKNFGQGAMFMAPEAMRRGMVDRIGTFDQVLAQALEGQRAPSHAAKADTVNWRRRLEIARRA